MAAGGFTCSARVGHVVVDHRRDGGWRSRTGNKGESGFEDERFHLKIHPKIISKIKSNTGIFSKDVFL